MQSKNAIIPILFLATLFLFSRCGEGSGSSDPINSGNISGTVTFIGEFDPGQPPDPNDSLAVRDTTFLNVAAYLTSIWDMRENRPLASPTRIVFLDTNAIRTGTFQYAFTDLVEGEYVIAARATKIDLSTGRPRIDSTILGLYRPDALNRDSLHHDTTHPARPPTTVKIAANSLAHENISFLAWAAADSVRPE